MSVLQIKYRFFLLRFLALMLLFLGPVLLINNFKLNPYLQTVLIILYIGFVMAQWFFLGKKMNRLLSIYVLGNSSIDHFLHNILTGMILFIIYFNLISIFPAHNYIFWITYPILGLIYAWPTKRKIIYESINTNLKSFQYLGPLEKMILFLTLVILIISVPSFPIFTDIEALKLFWDPHQQLNYQWWNFMQISYLPFSKKTVEIAWFLHFYLVGLGLLFGAFYAILRYNFSRKTSILGLFILSTSWQFSKYLFNDYQHLMLAASTTTLIWAMIFTIRSSCYQSGLLFGLISYLGVIICRSFSFLIIVQISAIFIFVHKSYWYKQKMMSFACFGFILAVLTFIMSFPSTIEYGQVKTLLVNLATTILSKSIFILVIIGIVSLIYNIKKYITNLYIYTYTLLGLLVFSMFIDSNLFASYNYITIIIYLSIIPIDLILLKSNRKNAIYLIYIIIALLDSHLESRLENFTKLFNI